MSVKNELHPVNEVTTLWIIVPIYLPRIFGTNGKSKFPCLARCHVGERTTIRNGSTSSSLNLNIVMCPGKLLTSVLLTQAEWSTSKSTRRPAAGTWKHRVGSRAVNICTSSILGARTARRRTEHAIFGCACQRSTNAGGIIGDQAGVPSASNANVAESDGMLIECVRGWRDCTSFKFWRCRAWEQRTSGRII